jgi:chromosome segregation ATPase
MLMFLICAMTSCTSASDGLRQELKNDQASWERQVAILKAEQAVLRERFDRQSSNRVAHPGEIQPAELRLRAVLEGARQSAVDVELEARQSAARAEQAIARGADEGEKSLTREREQMRTYLQGLTSQVATAGRDLDDLANSGSVSKAN